MTFTESMTQSGSHSFPPGLGFRSTQNRGRPGERLERSLDVALPPEGGELSRASILTVAMAVLIHRYTALDRVFIDVLDGRDTHFVALADESSTIDLMAGLRTAPRSD